MEEKVAVADEKSAKKNLDNVPDEKLSSHKVLGKFNCESSYWNILPDELVKNVLFCGSERSSYALFDHKSQTRHSILQTC